MRHFIISVLLITAAASPGRAWFGECDSKSPRQAAINALGATQIEIIARAGSLKVTGRSGATEVRATGTACASSSSLAAKIKLTASRRGSEIQIEAVIPDEESMFGTGDMRLDFAVELPSSIPVKIVDGSGEIEVAGLASLELRDGSGRVDIKDITGTLNVRDGSGSLTIADVRGDVTIDDTSGEIRVDRVAGNVVVEDDGSGSIEISNVRKNVVVRDDGSGSISAEEVGGSFTVEHDGSGGISYDRIAGAVRVPR